VPVLLFPAQILAQPISDSEISAQIETQRRTIALDAEGCPRYPDPDEITVCGDANKKERTERSPYDTDRIHRGQAVSTERGLGCIKGDRLCRTPMPGIGVSFGYVPVMPPDYHEVMKGLPEPGDIIKEGSGDALSEAPTP
jgi:hypothetical protein